MRNLFKNLPLFTPEIFKIRHHFKRAGNNYDIEKNRIPKESPTRQNCRMLQARFN
jgi:hypothetical protein